MSIKRNRDTFVFSVLMVMVLTLGLWAGQREGQKPENCRQVVMGDIRAHQKYDAELQLLLSPDFLTAMTKNK